MLELRIYGDPVLREKSTPVQVVDDTVRSLAADMIEAMRDSHGVGLAAQQIGKTVFLCVIEVPEDYDKQEDGTRLNPGLSMPLVLINPTLSDPSSGYRVADEGCLSFPEITGSIRRADEVTVTYLDEQGREHSHRFKGFAASVAQHEIDHLNGVLFIDRMTLVKRIALKSRLKKMKEETEQKMGIR